MAAECTASVVRVAERGGDGFDGRIWSEAARLGWLGCGIGEKFGGYGDFTDAILIAEEIGRSLCPVPYISTVIVGAHALATGLNDEIKAPLLSAIVSGQVIIAEAISDQKALPGRLAISRTDGHLSVSGGCQFIRDVSHADYILCRASDDGVELVLLIPTNSAGMHIEREANISGECLCSITLADVALPSTSIIGDASLVEAAVSRAWVAKSAWLLGAAERILEMTVEYAKTRVQFGVPIGSFQAVQHQCADMAIALTMGRGLVEMATSNLAKGLADRTAVLMAKLKMLDVYEAIVLGSHKVHGAIGLTREYDLSLYTRRALSSTLGAVSGDDDLSSLVECLDLR